MEIPLFLNVFIMFIVVIPRFKATLLNLEFRQNNIIHISFMLFIISSWWLLIVSIMQYFKRVSYFKINRDTSIVVKVSNMGSHFSYFCNRVLLREINRNWNLYLIWVFGVFCFCLFVFGVFLHYRVILIK